MLGVQRAQAEPVLAVFVCAHRTIVRAEIALDSAQTGPLEVGEEFEVVERRQLEDGALRVRGADGWCTAVNADGVAILEEQQLPMVARIRITDTESHRDKNRVGEYTSYVIECVGEGEPWRIVKRFSDFSPTSATSGLPAGCTTTVRTFMVTSAASPTSCRPSCRCRSPSSPSPPSCRPSSSSRSGPSSSRCRRSRRAPR